MKTKKRPRTTRAKLVLLREIYAHVRATAESFEQADRIGADLAYLLGAILNDRCCSWPAERPLVRLLQERYRPEHAVWKYLSVEIAPDTESVSCLKLAAPEWFAREDFLDWRQGKRPGQRGAPACWNPKDRSGEFADVFITYDRADGPEWEGSDTEDLPNDIYRAIGQLLEERKLDHGVIWLKPV